MSDPSQNEAEGGWWATKAAELKSGVKKGTTAATVWVSEKAEKGAANLKKGAEAAVDKVDEWIPEHIEEDYLGGDISGNYDKHVKPKVAAAADGAAAKAKKAAEVVSDMVTDVVDQVTNAMRGIDTDADAVDALKMARVQEQCYLGYHMYDLARLHQATQIAPCSLHRHEDLKDLFDDGTVDRFPQFGYQKTMCLNGRPGEIFSKLHLKPHAHELLDATTAQLAGMVPMIKIAKVISKNHKGEPIASYEVPFKFYNHIATHAQATSTDGWKDGPTDHFNRGTSNIQSRSGVGIKSFDWKYISGNFDTVQKDISATLVLYFQSMDELIRIRKTQVRDPATGDMKNVTYSYLDLIVNPARSSTSTSLSNEPQSTNSADPCLGSGNTRYDSVEYEIKATVGWANNGQALSNALEYSTTNIFLSLTDHAFNILQDGTFEVTINYKSRMEGITESPKSNILYCDKDIIEMESFKALIDNENRMTELNEKPDSCGELKAEKEQLAKANQQIQVSLRNETYRSIITNLMIPSRYMGYQPQSSALPQPEEGSGVVPQRLIYSVFVNPKEIIALSESKGAAQLSPLDYENVSTTDLVFKGGGGSPSWEDSDLSTKTADGKINFNLTNYEEKVINFFFLGDLLDMLMITVFDNEKYDSLEATMRKKYAFNPSEVEHLKLLLGPFEFRDPVTNNVKLINMANVPVSVRAFTEFFHRKVIKKQLMTYEFRTFMKDLVSELIQVCLGKECFEDAERHNSQVRTGYLAAPLMDGVADQIVYRSVDQGYVCDSSRPETWKVNMDLVTAAKPLFEDWDTSRTAIEHAHYIVFWAHGQKGIRYPGTPGNERTAGSAQIQDLNRGIHHLHIGRDKGLLTNIQFSKTNQPYLRQARLENNGSFDPLLQLSDVYEANIDMMGNTLFLPGDRIYVNPFGLSWGENFGSPHQRGSISNIMGLGGYHIVTGVSNYIESGKYKTSLETRFESSGDGCLVVNTGNDRTEPCPEEEEPTTQ